MDFDPLSASPRVSQGCSPLWQVYSSQTLTLRGRAGSLKEPCLFLQSSEFHRARKPNLKIMGVDQYPHMQAWLRSGHLHELYFKMVDPNTRLDCDALSFPSLYLASKAKSLCSWFLLSPKLGHPLCCTAREGHRVDEGRQCPSRS